MRQKLLLLLLGLSQFTYAQTNDSVATGASYANDIYYSFETGEVASSPRNNWDLAFSTGGQSSNILINDGQGTVLYLYANGDTVDWATLDTAGIGNWTPLYNTDTSWNVSAFNRYEVSSFDVGWGMYNMTTHAVNGDSIYVIQLSNGEYQKIWIKSLISGVYSVRYAALDNSFDTTISITKADFSTKNFGYYSIQNKEVVDREPVDTTWDIFFTKYYSNAISYNVTGVKLNQGVIASQIDDLPPSEALYASVDLSSDISIIGSDWKTFDMGCFCYVLDDSVSFFVQDVPGNIYHLYFTGFDGSSSGKYHFTKEKIMSVGVDEKEQKEVTLVMYPNPAGSQTNLVFQSFTNNQMVLKIQDINGRVLLTETLSANVGLNQYVLSLDGLSCGIYFVSLASQHQFIQQKLIVNQY